MIFFYDLYDNSIAKVTILTIKNDDSITKIVTSDIPVLLLVSYYSYYQNDDSIAKIINMNILVLRTTIRTRICKIIDDQFRIFQLLFCW